MNDLHNMSQDQLREMDVRILQRMSDEPEDMGKLEYALTIVRDEITKRLS